MTTSIAGDEPPRSNTAHANVSRTSAVDQQAREAPNLSSKLEVGDASVVNNLSGVPALATASQQGPPIPSTAAAAAAGPDHADISPAKDLLSRGTAIAQDQQPFDVKVTSNGETMPDSSPSYPIPIQPAQALDLPTVPASSGQVPPANGANASGTPQESNVTGATETQDGQGSEGVTQMEVDTAAAAAVPTAPAAAATAAPSPKKELPAFVQTSALISNSCGYCGTRSTSGCWRRGWEIGNGKFINLCNKCGLRHKAGKLHSVPQPTPSTQRRGSAAAAASPSRVITKTNPAAAAAAAAQNALTAAERETAAANAAAAVAAAAGLPGASTGELLRSIMQDQQQQQRPGSSSSLSSLLAVVAANAAAAAAGGDGSSGTAAAAGSGDDMQGLSAKEKLAVLLESLGFKTEGSGGYVNGDMSHHRDQVPRRMSSNIPRYADQNINVPPAAAAAANGSGHIDGLPDFNAAAGSSRSSIPASAAVSAVLAAAEAAAGSSSGDVQGLGSDLGMINGLNPDLVHYLSAGITAAAAADEPAPKRRRTKKAPGRLLLPAAAAAPAGQSRSAAAAAALEREDSLAVGAADALLTLNRSSPSGSPAAGSPTTIHPAAAAADEFPPTVPYDQAAAAAAADKAAAAAERAAAAAAAATVDAAASIAGWSPGPGNTNMLEAFLSGAFLKKARSGNMTAAAAAGGGRSSSRGPADHNASQGGFKRQQHSRQVTTSPNALRPGTHSLQPQTTSHQNPNSTNPNTSLTPRNNNLAGLAAAAAAATPITHNLTGSGNYSNAITGSGNYAHLTPAFSVRNWSVEKIYGWLHATGCNEAVRVFKDLDIDGLALAGLVRVAGADAARLHDVLKNDLGVQHVGLRLRLVEAMAALFAGDGVWGDLVLLTRV